MTKPNFFFFETCFCNGFGLVRSIPAPQIIIFVCFLVDLSSFFAISNAIYSLPDLLCPSTFSNMPRKHIRTSDKQMDQADLEKAFKHRVATGCSLQAACNMFGVKKMTLSVSLNRLALSY